MMPNGCLGSPVLVLPSALTKASSWMSDLSALAKTASERRSRRPTRTALRPSELLAPSVPGRGVVEGVREGPDGSDLLAELTDGQRPGVAGELTRRWLNDEWPAEAVQDLRSGGWYTQQRFPGFRKGLSAYSVRRAGTGAMP